MIVRYEFEKREKDTGDVFGRRGTRGASAWLREGGCDRREALRAKRARQAETAGPEPSGQTPRASGDATGKEQTAQSQADCRLVLYVAHKNISPKEAEAFSKLLAEMMRSMERLSWPEGALRNAALDHLAVPLYPECRVKNLSPRPATPYGSYSRKCVEG
jgi:hypothetical protein